MGIQIAAGEAGRNPHKITITETRNNSKLTLNTTTDGELREPATDRIYFPVDGAAEFQADTIIVPADRDLIIRQQQNGQFVDDNRAREDLMLPYEQYNIELSSTPMKVYLAVAAELEVAHTQHSLVLKFSEEKDVQVGARSFYRKPEHTIFTSRDPDDVMEALSYLGALTIEESPDRSFPTLRRHPPLLAWGDELTLPGDLTQPDTGITIEVPAEWEALYPVAPLAYYLGASLRAGAEARLLTDDGFIYPLTGPRGFEDTVHQVLKQVFTLDCVTRNGRLYDFDLRERTLLESRLPLDFDDLYDQSLAARVAAYLDVSFDRLADAVPDWHLTVDVEPTVESLTTIPFVANELPKIRTVQTRSPTAWQSNVGSGVDTDRQLNLSSFEASQVVLPATESIEHGWIGEQYPIDANKLTAGPLQASTLNPLNETSMTKYVVVSNRVDGTRLEDQFSVSNWNAVDVEFHSNVTERELRDILSGPADLVQFIGHVADRGLKCEWGYLDIDTLPATDVTVFLLNGCHSYTQAEKLIDKGSFAGVATVGDAGTVAACQFGRAVGKLLVTGFPVRTAVALARDVTGFEHSHLTLGNGGLTLRQLGTGGCPTFLRLAEIQDGFEVTIENYPGPGYELGSIFIDKYGQAKAHYLIPRTVEPFEISTERLIDTFIQETVPVELDGEILLSEEALITQMTG